MRLETMRLRLDYRPDFLSQYTLTLTELLASFLFAKQTNTNVLWTGFPFAKRTKANKNAGVSWQKAYRRLRKRYENTYD